MFEVRDYFNCKWALGILIAFTISLVVPTTGWSALVSSPETALSQIQVLDLETAVKISLAGNPSLAAAQARALQAAMAVKQAQSAYWPQLEATAGGSWVDMSKRDVDAQESSMALMAMLASGMGMDVPSSITDPQYYYKAGLTASWVIFNGFARKFSLASARYGEQAAVQAHQDARRQLLSAVIYAYLGAQLAKENIAIAQADAAFNNRLLSEAQLRYDVGAGALSDVINFQILGNAAQNQIVQDELAYQNAMIGLAMLMGVAQGRLPDHIQLAPFETTTASELASLDSGQLVDEALEQRPDIQQLDISIQAAAAGVQTAKSAYYPNVFLSAGIEGNRPEDMGFEEEDFGSTIALGMSWKLFAGGLTRARVGEAKAKVTELQNSLDYAKIGVANDVQSQVARIQSVQSQVTLQETNTELVQQQRDLVEKEYKSGVGSLVRLNEAQRTLTVTQGRLVLTRVALRQAWYNLQATTGRILTLFGADSATGPQN